MLFIRQNLFCLLLTIIAGMILTGCTTTPPKHPNQICKIFKQYPRWYWATQRAQKRWHIPISVQMAIINVESHYVADATPPRRYLLWIIPWGRVSSAKGYTQALDGTWRNYLHHTKQRSASRDNFSSATDFIGWYLNKIHHRLGISRTDAFHLYLAYHEGINGYKHHTYNHHRHLLLRKAHDVQRLAIRYHWQLVRCQRQLPHKFWWRLW